VAANQSASASSTALQERRELAITAPPVQTDAARAQAERLVGRGDQYLAQGNIVVARQYYLRAADQDDARAALKLAETYDPNEIERFNVVGLAANPAEAKRWYQRAAALGAADAESKLQRLSAR
jgi:TPR repeat protein